MNTTIKETEGGLYLTATRKGVTYGQTYATTDKAEALRKFTQLIRTYQTKGAHYVARYGTN